MRLLLSGGINGFQRRILLIVRYGLVHRVAKCAMGTSIAKESLMC
ncbi:MAG: hypothetical protein SPF89_10015 [Sphaerochaetaceae bacterium]|nr:hypothetical protein [Spirochaetales bacterium]MDY5500427.1 hypothetical protein [Sphaerochaetaceae bacterium]